MLCHGYFERITNGMDITKVIVAMLVDKVGGEIWDQ